MYPVSKLASPDSPPTERSESVIKDAPADRAGLREGDIIIELNGGEIEGISEFARSIRSADKAVTLKVLRDKEIRKFEVEPEARPADF